MKGLVQGGHDMMALNRTGQFKVMNCADIREYIYDFLDGNLSLHQWLRFRLHILFCRSCRSYFKMYREAAQGRDFFQTHPPPEEIKDLTLSFLEKRGIL